MKTHMQDSFQLSITSQLHEDSLGEGNSNEIKRFDDGERIGHGGWWEDGNGCAEISRDGNVQGGVLILVLMIVSCGGNCQEGPSNWPSTSFFLHLDSFSTSFIYKVSR